MTRAVSMDLYCSNGSAGPVPANRVVKRLGLALPRPDYRPLPSLIVHRRRPDGVGVSGTVLAFSP